MESTSSCRLVVIVDRRDKPHGERSPMLLPFGSYPTALDATLGRAAIVDPELIVVTTDAPENARVRDRVERLHIRTVVAPRGASQLQLALRAADAANATDLILVDPHAVFLSPTLLQQQRTTHVRERADLTLAPRAAHGLAGVVASRRFIADVERATARLEWRMWDSDADALRDLSQARMWAERVADVAPEPRLACAPACLIPRNATELAELSPFALPAQSESYDRVLDAMCQRAFAAWPAARRATTADRKRILVNDFHDAVSPGAWQAGQVMMGLDRARFEVAVVQPWMPSRLSGRLSACSLHALRSPFFASGEDTTGTRWWPDAVARATELVGEVQPHVVLIIGFDPALATAARCHRVPVVNLLQVPMFGAPQRIGAELALRSGITAANRLLCPSGWVERHYRDAFRPPDGVLHRCVLGVDTAEFDPSGLDRETQRKKLGLPSGVPILGMGFEINARLRLHIGIEALADLPGVHVAIAGGEFEPATRAALVALAEQKGVANRVHWIGTITDLRSFLVATDLFANLSVPEPIGINSLQAMAVGRPVIAIEGEGSAEPITDGVNGLIVPAAAGPAVVAAALDGVLRDRARAERMGKAARERILAGYDLSQNMERLGDLLADVAERGS